MIGGVGQRMLTSVAKRTAGEFFAAVDQVLAGGASAPTGGGAATGADAAGAPGPGPAPAAPARAGGGGGRGRACTPPPAPAATRAGIAGGEFAAGVAPRRRRAPCSAPSVGGYLARRAASAG